MDDTEIARFRALIETQLAGLEEDNALGREGQGVVTLDQQSVGRLNRMDALQNQAMAKAAQVRRDALGRRLRVALKRIDEGRFGCCEDCRDEIAMKRLELDPGVTRCISCASG